MKLLKPKLFKNYQNSFSDIRGFLNPISLESLLRKKELSNFTSEYQLISFTKNAHTFRGFHFQKPPSQQVKILIVHAGKILDIVFPFTDPNEKDLITYELEAGDILLIPNNYAHGFYTKSSDVLLQYILDKEFDPENYTGFNGFKYISEKIGRNDVLISDHDLKLPMLNFN